MSALPLAAGALPSLSFSPPSNAQSGASGQSHGQFATGAFGGGGSSVNWLAVGALALAAAVLWRALK